MKRITTMREGSTGQSRLWGASTRGTGEVEAGAVADVMIAVTEAVEDGVTGAVGGLIVVAEDVAVDTDARAQPWNNSILMTIYIYI